MKSGDVIKALKKEASKEKALVYARFFKTGKGQYGEGDVFLGLTAPQSRGISKRFIGLTLPEVLSLLKSPYHEARLVALHILVSKYQKGNEKEKIFKFYVKNLKYVNNWDLVDSSAYQILGQHLEDKNRDLLLRLSSSKNIWERRVSIVSTYHFIRNNDFSSTLFISEKLLSDKHDLIHKAVGWMLREVGKRSLETLRTFLNSHYASMPRTSLRYAIEKLSHAEKKKYLTKI